MTSKEMMIDTPIAENQDTSNKTTLNEEEEITKEPKSVGACD